MSLLFAKWQDIWLRELQNIKTYVVQQKKKESENS
ncbi:hypothetical protein HMPREF1536_02752 [Parabacteroides gordonii MS-1 = DSM 23371]|uniref:Uncharacterized protein n=1 Tax=Parabacteroides gordonii MS-1 = DSM 23371 TaxID=1203610 RepID=A0A0F5JBZ7_9BACT|nr:hypothetical protein HMPREF1536_02752 [Parabacteroides gordonii MS-1 = DSM 23371]